MAAPGGCGCKGYFNKMCSKCADIKPYVVYLPDQGYVWGPGYPVENDRGKPMYAKAVKKPVVVEYGPEQAAASLKRMAEVALTPEYQARQAAWEKK